MNLLLDDEDFLNSLPISTEGKIIKQGNNNVSLAEKRKAKELEKMLNKNKKDVEHDLNAELVNSGSIFISDDDNERIPDDTGRKAGHNEEKASTSQSNQSSSNKTGHSEEKASTSQSNQSGLKKHPKANNPLNRSGSDKHLDADTSLKDNKKKKKNKKSPIKFGSCHLCIPFHQGKNNFKKNYNKIFDLIYFQMQQKKKKLLP